jgi:hypothetical protein
VGDPIFGLVAQGAKRAVLGDRVFDYAVDPVQQVLDRRAQIDVVDVAQDECCFDDPAATSRPRRGSSPRYSRLLPDR